MIQSQALKLIENYFYIIDKQIFGQKSIINCIVLKNIPLYNKNVKDEMNERGLKWKIIQL